MWIPYRRNIYVRTENGISDLLYYLYLYCIKEIKDVNKFDKETVNYSIKLFTGAAEDR